MFTTLSGFRFETIGSPEPAPRQPAGVFRAGGLWRSSVGFVPSAPGPDQRVIPAFVAAHQAGVEGRHHARIIEEDREVGVPLLGALGPGRADLGSPGVHAMAWPGLGGLFGGLMRTSLARIVRVAISPVNSLPYLVNLPMVVMSISCFLLEPASIAASMAIQVPGADSTPHPSDRSGSGGRCRPGFLPREECGPAAGEESRTAPLR